MLGVKYLESTWGHCGRARRLRLQQSLVRCIDILIYIVFLCHLTISSCLNWVRVLYRPIYLILGQLLKVDCCYSTVVSILVSTLNRYQSVIVSRGFWTVTLLQQCSIMIWNWYRILEKRRHRFGRYLCIYFRFSTRYNLTKCRLQKVSTCMDCCFVLFLII